MADLPSNPPSTPAIDWKEQIRGKQSSSTAHQESAVDDGASLDGEDAPPSGKFPDELRDEKIADMRANRQLREKFANKAYRLAVGCLGCWGVLLAAQGFVKACFGIELWTEKVIIAVTTGVTVSVLAAFLGVIRGLFPHRERQK
ncbi:hypothetical protein [Verminephrobacter eiseniae]|uniref:Transmembrane protein n=1 Tax=Verminephrobacter eiseniae (strain EF01-2) TaxID=391735 RepID=A1WHI2_VEREI|nr:hypothetical protein [Verminephrobacter eiseniae]ABM57089.1 hypothetical protein Veis_1322 [Verminephrobacter eiseniae EF01-2]MCW5287425.1 hypothetical protein [Verminephrobacter eiseniae]MCW5305724.1 hypothetical protein [Verminephrobacter eiseniae]MCW8180014.1 hypothetical protein [Verminephrobacter eiseniae]MCW8188470.1 hypothetical protein [Verminephrobacter eiseniae]